MKVVISLEKVPLTVKIEGSDDAMSDIGIIVEDSLARMKKIWLDHLKRQTKLDDERTKKNEE